MKKVIVTNLLAVTFATLLVEAVLQVASLAAPNLNRILTRQGGESRVMEHGLLRNVGNP